jgi:hypothetical protein
MSFDTMVIVRMNSIDGLFICLGITALGYIGVKYFEYKLEEEKELRNRNCVCSEARN